MKLNKYTYFCLGFLIIALSGCGYKSKEQWKKEYDDSVRLVKGVEDSIKSIKLSEDSIKMEAAKVKRELEAANTSENTDMPNSNNMGNARPFSNMTDVFMYLNSKEFVLNGTRVSIGYSSELNSYGIMVNGAARYFQLDVHVLSPNMAIIKGYSLSNPDGVIRLTVNSASNTITDGTSTYNLR